MLYGIKCNKCPCRSKSALCDEPCGRLITFKPSKNNLIEARVEGCLASELVIIYAPSQTTVNLGCVVYQTHVMQEFLGPAWKLMSHYTHVNGKGSSPLFDISDPGGWLGCLFGLNYRVLEG